MCCFESLPFRAIGRILGFSNVSILNWIKAFGKIAKKRVKLSKQESKTLELYEMHTYINSKKNIAGYG